MQRGKISMSNDFNNLRNSQKTLQNSMDKVADLKQATNKPQKMVRFIITKNKSNSLIDDIHAQAQLKQAKRVFN